MSTYLVTGGGGYLGSSLVDTLSRDGHRVVSVDNHHISQARLDRDNVVYVEGDIRDVAEWESLLPGTDGVIHLAAIVGDPASGIAQELTWETNYLGTVHLAEACRRAAVRRFVFASTCSNYGVSGPEEVDALAPLCPQSVYATSKVQTEHYLLSARSSNFEPAIMRFATLFGLSHRMRFDLAVNVMTARAFIEGAITVFNGTQWRPFLHVGDAARSIRTVLDQVSPGAFPEIYNCGSSRNNFRINDIAAMIQQEIPEAVIRIQDSDQDARDYRVNFDLLSERTGFTPRVAVIDGIREIVNSLRSGSFNDALKSGEYSNVDTMFARRDENHPSVRQRHAMPWPRINYEKK